MTWFSSWRGTGKISVIFDIGNASVGGALLSVEGDGKPRLLFTHREAIPVGRELDMKRLLPKMKKALGATAAVLQKEGVARLRQQVPGPLVHDIYCILAAPWSISRTKILKIKRAKPFSVTVDLLEEMAANEELLFDKGLGDDPDRVELGHGPLILMEKKVIKTRLNGYEVSDPFDKKATRIELSLFLSATTEMVSKAVEDAVRGAFGHQKVNFNTFNLVAYTALRDAYPRKEDFLFIDVSGEMTDIMLVRHHVILETLSFPFGRNAIIRRLSRAVNSEPEIAASELRVYWEQKTEDQSKNKLRDALTEASGGWLKLFDISIASLSKNDFVPTTVFITADREVSPLFVNAIAERKVGQFSLEGESFKVVPINHETLQNFISAAPGIELDEFLTLESMFLRRVNLLRMSLFHPGVPPLSDVREGKKLFAL